MPKTTKTTNLSAKIARKLIGFADNENKPVKLPSERTLAEKFSVSRRQIRLAIDRLSEKGLIVRKHGSGNYLLPKKIKTDVVNIIIPEDIKSDDPFYNSLIAQFFFYAHENNIKLTPIKLSDYMLLNPEVPIVLPGRIKKEKLLKLREMTIHSSIISLVDIEEQEQTKDENFCCLFYDDYFIGKQAAKIIAQYNHKNVLFLAGSKSEYLSSARRYESFLIKAYELGLNVKIMNCKMNYTGGYEAMSEYIRENNVNNRNRATAIFASTDWTAAGAYYAIAQAGLCVPEDFSIIGCDDVPLAKQLMPALSTFRLDIENLVEQTFSLIEQSWRTDMPAKVILKPKFIKRQSLIFLREQRYETERQY